MDKEEKQYKVILVDDDDFLVNMYVTKFNSNGIAVDACNSGEMLLEKLRAGVNADLILLDIIMSNLNGIETLKQIREEKLAEGIPVVMLTNQNDEKDIEASKRLNVSAYIVKSSLTPLEVVNEVVEVLKKQSSKK